VYFCLFFHFRLPLDLSTNFLARVRSHPTTHLLPYYFRRHFFSICFVCFSVFCLEYS
jgi:hypothetical protein